PAIAAAKRWRNHATIAAGRHSRPNNKSPPADNKATQARGSTVSSLTLRLRPTAISQSNFGIRGLSKELIASPISRPTRLFPLLPNKLFQSVLKKSAYMVTCKPKPIRNSVSHVSLSDGNRKARKRGQHLYSGLRLTLASQTKSAGHLAIAYCGSSPRRLKS